MNSAGRRPPLVFIHGIKGSVLADSRGEIRWFTLSEGLGLSSPDLRLPLEWRGAAQNRDGLAATAPLSTVGWHKVYAPFLNWAAGSGRAFRAFAYDWRRDNLESTDEFIRFVEKMSGENGGSRVQVAAHSMGGLITFAAMKRRPDLFHSMLFAGVPFGKSINFLEDMHAGTANGLNKHILSPEVMFTFVSPYALFPIDPNESGLFDLGGNVVRHDWFSAEDWERHKLGIFANSGSSGVSATQREHLRNALRQARVFKSSIVYSRSDSYPPIAVLAGDTRPTLCTAIQDGPRAIKGWDFATSPRKPGDGRVDFDGAAPPAGVPYRLFKSSLAHEDLLNETEQVEVILRELLR